MGQHDLIIFFLQIGILLAVASVFGRLMRNWHQPPVLGELIGGILIGPTICGHLFPGPYASLFPVEGAVTAAREAVIWLGMLFFLFVAGLEVNLEHLRQRGLSVVLTSLMGIVFPFSLGFGLVLLFPGLWGSHGSGQILILALFIGTALSISALPVIARVLMDIGLMKKGLGVTVLASATVDDLIGWSLFALILSHYLPNNLSGRGFGMTFAMVFGFAALTLTAGRWLGKRGLRWVHSHLTWPGGFIVASTIVVLAAASITEAIGVHAIFGAFLVGVALSQKSEEMERAHDVIQLFAISFFAPLYFASIGLRADFLANFDLPLVLVVLTVACLGKVCGAGLGAWIGGMTLRESLAVGFGMNARGAMEIILASVALDYGLIDQRIFVALVVMALVTSMISGPVMKRLLRESPEGGGGLQQARAG